MGTWNLACVVRHIWAVLFRQGSLWVAWIWEYRIKGGNFWTLTSKAGSWLWQKILKIRDKVRGWFSVASDGVYWKGALMPKLCIRKVWEEFGPKRSYVPWKTLIWKGPNIPRNQFLVWLVVTDCITTGEKAQG
ncbi:unnamed protein product [Linum trigynum]|uniref:Reverse transcriptase zinc-binding domain-containing protein n=1 Tax=Linum trigynum TaxID=586398 RepID=A0AAV2GQA9_9ROSI